MEIYNEVRCFGLTMMLIPSGHKLFHFTLLLQWLCASSTCTNPIIHLFNPPKILLIICLCKCVVVVVVVVLFCFVLFFFFGGGGKIGV